MYFSISLPFLAVMFGMVVAGLLIGSVIAKRLRGRQTTSP
jgi:hypothetical protein